jgi:hypothetical protein
MEKNVFPELIGYIRPELFVKHTEKMNGAAMEQITKIARSTPSGLMVTAEIEYSQLTKDTDRKPKRFVRLVLEPKEENEGSF